MRKSVFLLLFSLLALSLANAQNGCPTMNSFTWSPSAQVGDGRHVATASISVSLNQFNGQFFAINFLDWPSSSDECEPASFRTVFAFSCYLPMGSTSMTDMAFISGASDQPYDVDTQAYVACGNNSLLHANFTVLPAPTSTAAPDPSDTNPKCEDCSKAGQPINLANGNTWIEQNDYSLSDFRGGLSLTRTWHSGWNEFNPPATVGMFGSGWTSTFEQRLQQYTVAGTSGYKSWNGSGNSEFFRFDSTLGTYSIYAPFDSVSGLSFNSTNSTFTYTLKDGTQEIFNQAGYLTAIKDRNGNTTSITLDAQNRITQVQNAVGRTITFAYADAVNPNQATSLTDPCTSCVGGATVATYTYFQDGTHRLQKVTYSDGTVLQFQYNDPNSNTLISEVDDGAGKVIEKHTYDSLRRGLTSSKAVVAGSSTPVDQVTVTYPPPGPIPATGLTNSLGVGTAYDFVTTGQRHLLTDAVGPGCSTCISRSTLQRYYTSDGDVAVEVDANGNSLSYTYDANHNIASRATNVYDYNGNHTGKQTFGYTYNSFGEVTSSTDPLGRITNYNYDTHGNLLYVQTPSPDGGTTPGSKTQFGYDPAGTGEIISITDPNNNVTTIHYNTWGLVDYFLDAQQNETQFAYNPRSQRTQITDPLNNITKFQHDARGRLTKITYPDLTNTQYGYDTTRGRLHTATDQNAKITTYDYDDADRLIKVTDPQTPTAGVTQYAYDTEDNLTSITDALGRVTCFQHNNDGTLSETDFQAGPGCTSTAIHETYTYDAVGNLKSKTDRNGHEIDFDYDTLNRLNFKTWVGSSPAYSVNYNYKTVAQVDGTTATVDLLSSVTDPTGTYSFTYDGMDRLTEADTAWTLANAPSAVQRVNYSYDPASNRKTLTDPQGSQNTYNYDTLNRLYQLLSPSGTFGMGYDTDSRRTSLTRPNGVSTTYGYDVNSMLNSITAKLGATTLDGMTYSHTSGATTDHVNWKQKTNLLNNLTYVFTYDNINQLTKVVQGSTTKEQYTYDRVGNRLTANYGGTGNWNYNNANELTSRPNNTYTYDANDNTKTLVTSAGTTTYNWDYENRLTSVVLPGSGGTISYAYDPFGRRTQKLAPAATRNYIYDGANAIEDLDQNGALVARFTYDLGVDQLLAQQRSSVNTFHEQDAVGTVTSLTNSSGTIANSYVYNEFGQAYSYSETVTNNFHFGGRNRDSEDSLDYFRARYYDESTGRFLNEDPMRFVAGYNFYVFTENAPTSHRDTSGEKTEVIFWNPLPYFGSEWGHVSTVINGTSYSWGPQPGHNLLKECCKPGKMNIDTTGSYVTSNQQIRSGIGYVLNLTPDQEQQVIQFLNHYQQEPPDYNALTNNCLDPIAKALEAAGVAQFPFFAFPDSFEDYLLGKPGLVSDWNTYPQTTSTK